MIFSFAWTEYVILFGLFYGFMRGEEQVDISWLARRLPLSAQSHSEFGNKSVSMCVIQKYKIIIISMQ